MPSSSELLDTARLLVAAAPLPASDARLRRALSTAYYAVFHHIAWSAARRFIDPSGGSSGYSLIYRSFEHGTMRAACKALAEPKLGPRLKRQLGRSHISQGMQEFASYFEPLQDQRHLADYDPNFAFDDKDVTAMIDAAETAIAAFDGAPADEQADVLALMMVKPR